MRAGLSILLIVNLIGLLIATGCTTARRGSGAAAPPAPPRTWVADNGNGTFSNPLFYEEFSDPDVIRVGEDYYLTGTTMHTVPGLPVLHSRDLVNWELLSYAEDRLDLGPEFRLDGREAYGQGIWAPSIRYHNGTFYIFTCVNNHGTLVYRSSSPAGPWKRNLLPRLYDLSVLFDDDGKIWAVHGVREISIVQLNDDVTDIVPGTQRLIIRPNLGMGEGLHVYKINGLYYIVSAIPGANTPMVCARSKSLEGPWEIETLVTGESQGVGTGYRLRGTPRGENPTFNVIPPDINQRGGLTIHQGGIVDTPSGEWWSVIMQDHNSVGRVSCLAPITWTDGWPILGLPGNLRKSPKLWIKPNTGHSQPPKPLFTRDDNFDNGKLNPIWQWNHVPDDSKWSLTERAGSLRLHSLAARDFWWARNTLTQRSGGPESTVTVELDASGTRPSDVAGLALLNSPYAWIGFARDSDGAMSIRRFDQISGNTISEPIASNRLWLRVHCNFDTELATFSFSTDGSSFKPLGDPFTMIFQLRTFQGVRYSLFHYNTGGSAGGYADFDNFRVDEPRPRGLTQPIPVGKTIVLTSAGDGSVLVMRDGALYSVAASDPAASSPSARFRVLDRSLGRIALEPVDGPGRAASEPFQWIDMQQRGEIMLMSLVNHRYLLARPNGPGPVVAEHTVPRPDGKDGSCFTWKIVE